MLFRSEGIVLHANSLTSMRGAMLGLGVYNPDLLGPIALAVVPALIKAQVDSKQEARSVEVAEANLRALHTPLLFHGHTHIPALWSARDEIVQSTPIGAEPISLRIGSLVNAGSVGQPRDRDPRAAWLLWERDELGAGLGTATWRRVEYNIPAAQEAIDAAGLPDFLASRLAVGR